jgi:hypothetical protein
MHATYCTDRGAGSTLDAMTVARARSILEMQFAASLEPCPQCGTRIGAQDLSLAGQADAWALTGNCPTCGLPRAFKFRSYGDPLDGAAPRDELGGPAPSEIIAPAGWIAEIERLRPLVHADPTQLDVDAWTASRDANRRTLVCVNELRKFVPAGAERIPDVGAGDVRYTAAWMAAVREACLQTRARYIADLPRIEARMGPG